MPINHVLYAPPVLKLNRNRNTAVMVSAIAVASLAPIPLTAQTIVPPVQTSPLPVTPVLKAILPGFHRGPWFHEQVCEDWVEPGIHLILNAPEHFDPSKATRLIVYATPNGNTVEQTLGSALAGTSTDWHFDIQHIAAQTRRLREVTPDENIVFACVGPDELSWPAWRQKHTDNAARIRALVEALRAKLPGEVRVTLTGHSGGGSFLFGFINGGDTLPDYVDRIAFLDANYSYNDDTDHHGDKLLAWLKADTKRHLVVIAYDDRNIMLNGKKVVGPTGGTFRACDRMLARFGKDLSFTESKTGPFVTSAGWDGRIQFFRHPNPENKILHTALVGEMNGYLEAMTWGTPLAASWGTFGGPRAYNAWIIPAAGIPTRPTDAPGGAAFMAKIADLPPAEREEAIGAELCRGNIPDFLRAFHSLTVHSTDATGKEHTAVYDVMPDYLAVGSDTDFVRVPMTPMTAQRIADAFGCSLITRKLSDDIYHQATVKLEPHPLTEAREAVPTFVQHNALIEEQRTGKPLGELIAGIKKDVVLTNRLSEKPNRVAIYGWHKLDGSPIQPLTIVHRDTYVDYSHGIRLIRRTVKVDGKPRDIHDILRSPELAPLLSDEGPIIRPAY